MRNRKKYKNGYAPHLFSEEALKEASKLIKKGSVCFEYTSGSTWWMLKFFSDAKLVAIGDFRKLYNQRAPLKGIKALEKDFKKVIRGKKK